VSADLSEYRYWYWSGASVLGCPLGVRWSAQGPVRLVYVDAHADFATPEESRTGSMASMCLALLARLASGEPLVHGKDVVLIGRRDAAQTWQRMTGKICCLCSNSLSEALSA
jgi:hypothetical protein